MHEFLAEDNSKDNIPLPNFKPQGSAHLLWKQANPAQALHYYITRGEKLKEFKTIYTLIDDVLLYLTSHRDTYRLVLKFFNMYTPPENVRTSEYRNCDRYVRFKPSHSSQPSKKTVTTTGIKRPSPTSSKTSRMPKNILNSMSSRCSAQSDDEYEELPPADYLVNQDEEPGEYDPYESEYTTDDHVHYTETAPRQIPQSEKPCFPVVNYGACKEPGCPYNLSREVNLRENLRVAEMLRDSAVHNAKPDPRPPNQPLSHVADRAHYTRDVLSRRA